ncbi:MAG: peptidoglycan DD-metalloendopeptidase family protein [Vicinamibacterales bacterium]
MISRALRVAAVGVVLLATAPLAQQADREQSETLSRRASDRLRSLRDEADRLAAEERTILGDLRKLEVAREIRSTELERARDEAQSAGVALAALDQQVDALTAQANAALPDLHARLITLYKLGRGQYARMLLSASDLRQLGQAVRLVSALAEQDRQRMQQQHARLTELDGVRERARQRQADVQRLEEAASQAQATAESAIAAHTALVHDIDSRRDLNSQYASELLTAQQRLQTSLTGLSGGVVAALPLAPFKGALDWPVAGTLFRPFGDSGAGRPPLRGVELSTAEGAAVQAVHEGVVAYADSFTGYGRLVIVDHGGQTFSLYGNLAEIAIDKGSRVESGTKVGTVGLGPSATPVLYFELRVDGRPVDPVQWLTIR